MTGKFEIWIAVVLVTLTAFSCEEYQEGCMDANATNYRVSHQVPCCCEYPNLIFQTTLINEEATSSFADTFTNDYGQRFLVRDLRFIASDIILGDSLDRTYPPTDTLHDYTISPDVMAVDVLNLNSAGGNFMPNGRFNTLDFSIGVDGGLENRVPRDFPLDHPFRDSLFYDFNQQEWYAFKATIEVVDQGLVQLQLTRNEWPVPMVIHGDWEKRRGSDLTVNFKININELFGNIDFSVEPEGLRSRIAENLPGSFEP